MYHWLFVPLVIYHWHYCVVGVAHMNPIYSLPCAPSLSPPVPPPMCHVLCRLDIFFQPVPAAAQSSYRLTLSDRTMSGPSVLAFGVLPHHVSVKQELPQVRGALSSGFSSMESSRSRSRTKTFAISELVGASEETGGVFDPLGLATDEVRRLGYCCTHLRVDAARWHWRG